jgi:hypothetical protein
MSEQRMHHIGVHVTVFVDGAQRQVPAGIGTSGVQLQQIPSGPIWGQPLSATQVGPATGTVTVFVDGRPYTGDPRAIGFTEHEEIQLEVGTPLVAPVTVANWGCL